MTDAEPAITRADFLSELDRLNSEWAALMARARSALVGNIVAVSDAPPTAPPVDSGPHGMDISDLIPAGAAAAIARRSKSTINTWCRSNAVDGEDGFAVKIGGRWWVSKGRLLRHLASDSRD